MNSDYAEAVERYAVMVGETDSGWYLSDIDLEGLDLSSGDNVARLWSLLP